MKPIKIINTLRSDILEIRWLPNNVCNFECRYCHPHSHDGDYGSPKDLDLIVKNFNHMAREYREKLGKKTIHLKIAGGEPTLWRDLAEFTAAVKKENDIYLTIISNGSRTIRWWQENGHLFDNAHLTFHVGQGKIDHMIEVADILHSLGKKTTVKVLMDPYQWDEAVAAVEYLKANSREEWFIIVGEVQEPETTAAAMTRVIIREDKKYTDEQIAYMRDSRKRMPGAEWFKANQFLLETGAIRDKESIAVFKDGTQLEASPNYYINNTFNSFYGWSCSLGVENFSIHWDGELKGSCGQSLYGLDYNYNILDADFADKFTLDTNPVICKKYICGCQPEHHISKHQL